MESDDVQLTDEERALLTAFDALAHDVMRTMGRENGAIAPCWLCCSDEARSEARNEALWLLRGATGRMTLSMDEATKMAHLAISGAMVDRWREAEESHKRERAAGNPRAFFAD